MKYVLTLRPCAQPGCRRLTHMPKCPHHADDDQRELLRLRAEALVELGVLQDRVRELDERLGITRSLQ